jgi:hypothetical protein
VGEGGRKGEGGREERGKREAGGFTKMLTVELFNLSPLAQG